MSAVLLSGISANPQKLPDAELWAVIGVREPIIYENSNYVNVSFGLVNDSSQIVNTDPRSWKIVINGQDVPSSDFIFANGPTPSGGWGTLQPGASFIFGKAFSLAEYFSKPGIYEITWKGSTFSAKPVLLRILTYPH